MDDNLQPAQDITDDNVPQDTQGTEQPETQSAPVEPTTTNTSQTPDSSNPSQAPQNGGQYDEEIKSDKIETKRKTFFMDLKANSMGRYVKISERSSGKRSTIIIPEENIAEFIEKLQNLLN